MKLKKKAEPVKEQPKAKPKPKPAPEPEPEPEEESEEEEEEEEYEPPPRKVNVKQPVPPPKQITRKKAPTDEDLYSNANIEMLRNKLRQQTLQRLNQDLFNY